MTLDRDDDAAPVFVPTSIAQDVQDTATFAQRFGWAVAVTGPAGIGKSTTLRRIAGNNPRAVYGEARQFRSEQALLRFVTSGLGFHVYDGRSNESLRDILVYNLPDAVARGAILLIDEMQELSLDALRTVVGWSEDHKLPVVLVGNDRSLRARPRMDTSTFDQILSRISKVTRLTGPTARDYAEYALAHGVTGGTAAAAAAHYGLRTSFRALRNLLKVAADLGGGSPGLDLSQLQTALRFVTGDDACERLLKPLPKAA